MVDYDTPWKEALEHYFPEFMAFFFPAAHADIDWNQGYEFLDKELQQVVRDAELVLPAFARTQCTVCIQEKVAAIYSAYDEASTPLALMEIRAPLTPTL